MTSRRVLRNLRRFPADEIVLHETKGWRRVGVKTSRARLVMEAIRLGRHFTTEEMAYFITQG